MEGWKPGLDEPRPSQPGLKARKQPTKTSPTQRSLKLLREEGYTCEVVERFIPFPKPGHRKDLYGFADILAVHPFLGTLAVQCCVGSGMSARRKKLAEEPNVTICKLAKWRIEIHGWVARKVYKGGTAVRYELKREEV